MQLDINGWKIAALELAQGEAERDGPTVGAVLRAGAAIFMLAGWVAIAAGLARGGDVRPYGLCFIGCQCLSLAIKAAAGRATGANGSFERTVRLSRLNRPRGKARWKCTVRADNHRARALGYGATPLEALKGIVQANPECFAPAYLAVVEPRCSERNGKEGA